MRRDKFKGGLNKKRAAVGRAFREVSFACVLSPSLPYSVVTLLNVGRARIVTRIDIKSNQIFSLLTGQIRVHANVRAALGETLDVCSKCSETLIDALVAAVDEFDPVDLAAAVCDESSHHQRDPGPNVGAREFAALQV